MVKRVQGQAIRVNQPLLKGLKDVYGVSDALARKIVEGTGLLGWVKMSYLSDKEWSSVRESVNKFESEIGLARKRKEQAAMSALYNSGSLRGIRMRKGYPVRGQRTNSNAKTANRLNPGRVRGRS